MSHTSEDAYRKHATAGAEQVREFLRSPEQDTHIECPNKCGDTLTLLPQDGVLWCHTCMEEFGLELKHHRGY